jgi:hypothetical protein
MADAEEDHPLLKKPGGQKAMADYSLPAVVMLFLFPALGGFLFG